MAPATPPSPDPIELELFRNLFEAAAEEMGITLQRTAFSANIKERRDFSCALFDAAGRLLAQAAHIPVHLGSMPASVKAVLDRLGPLHPGDTAIVNDPYAGGTHLPDITLITPIYVKKDEGGRMKDENGEDGSQKTEVGSGDPSSSSFSLHPSSLLLLGYSANRAHHADVGGSTPGSMTLSRHIDDEGLRLEPVLLHRAGQRVPETWEKILSAVRTPAERVGDLEAQLAANHVGAAALARMVDRYGPEKVSRYAAALLDYSHAFMQKTLASIPPGTYTFEDSLDDDGAGTSPVPIRLKLTIDPTPGGGGVTADFTQSSPQVPGCVNTPAAVTASAVYYCFACLLGESVPLNDGCFRDIHILTRPGTVTHATYPAAVVAGNTETSQRIVDVCLGALAQALPDKIPAASCGTMSSLALGSPSSNPQSEIRNPQSTWTYYETIGGGSGAGPTWPGTPAIQCHMTNTLNTPAEALEMQYPLRVLAYHILDNGGPGLHPGGGGIRRTIQALAPCEGTLLADRRITQPYGLHAGQPAPPGSQLLHTPAGTSPLPGKTTFHLNPGDSLEIQTPGGGGWDQHP